MKARRIIALAIATILLFSTLGNRSLAVDEAPKVRLIQTVGDGLRYYIVYQVNGHEFRSDRTGNRVNEMAFSLFNEEEKNK